MIYFISILVTLNTIAIGVILIKLKDFIDKIDTIGDKQINEFKNINNIHLVLSNFLKRLDSIQSFSTPLKSIAKDINKINEVNDKVLNIQTGLVVVKNIVEENRNLIKAIRASKKSKTNKTSSKEKSLNTSDSVKPQRV